MTTYIYIHPRMAGKDGQKVWDAYIDTDTNVDIDIDTGIL